MCFIVHCILLYIFIYFKCKNVSLPSALRLCVIIIIIIIVLLYKKKALCGSIVLLSWCITFVFLFFNFFN